MAYKNILLSLDCRDDEKRVLDEAMNLKSYFGASLSVVHINDPGAGKAHMLMDTLPRVSENDIVNQFEKFGYGEEARRSKIILNDSETYAKAIARVKYSVLLSIPLQVMGIMRTPFFAAKRVKYCNRLTVLSS